MNALLFKKIAFATFALIVIVCLAVMFGGSGKRDGTATAAISDKWTCSMCPQFILPDPGKCPKCFMDLIPLEGNAGAGSRLELYLTSEEVELAGIHTEIAERGEPAGVKAGIGDNPGDPPLSIPASAVLRAKGRTFVYVESVEEEHLVYALREIESFGMNEGRLLIASGLDEGEAVAVSGVFRIDSAMQILGKTSLANLPAGELSDALEDELPPYQPALRSSVNIRGDMPDVDAWFARYEQVRAALARDEKAEADRPSRELTELLAKADSSPDAELDDILSRLAASSRELSRAGDLDAKRLAFETITADMVLVARRYGSPVGGLNLVFCPMAFGGSGAYWLQPGDVVDNPYHGLEMPLCGWLVDNIQPFTPGDAAEAVSPQE